MRSTTVFFILGLVVLASATQEVDVFAEIDSHPFGSSLLDLVQMNMNTFAQTEMKTEDTINQISDLLAGIHSEMRSNKARGDAEHKDFQDKVNYDIAESSRTLAEQKARRVAVSQQLDNDRKALAAAKADLASAQKHAASVKASIKAADALRVKQAAAFEKVVRELNEAIQACKDAVKELSKLGVVSLAEGQSLNMEELKSKMEKVQSVLKAHMPTQLTLYQPIISALVQMGTNADPKLVAQVVGLINVLRARFQQELSGAIRQEGVRIADYQRSRANLVTDLHNTQARIGRDLANIRLLNANIRVNQAILDSLNVSIPAVEKLLALRKSQKHAEQAQYEKDNSQRVSELSVIARLISFFHEKLASSSTGLSAHLRRRLRH